MNLFLAQSYTNYETFYEDALRWNLEFKKLDKGNFNGIINLIDIGDIQVGRIKLTGKIAQQGISPKGFRTFVIPGDNLQSFYWLNRKVVSKDLLIFSEHGDLEALSFSQFHHYMISIKEELLNEIIEKHKIIVPANKLDSSEKVFTLNIGYFIYLQTYLQIIFKQLNTNPSLINTVAFQHKLKYKLPLMILNFLDTKELNTVLPLDRKRDAALIKCKEYIAKQNLNNISLTRLTEISDVTERTLELAFLERFGITPKTYINNVKLNEVRSELLYSGKKELISNVAKKIGFNHMGQFSAAYKKLFDELPSETSLSV